MRSEKKKEKADMEAKKTKQTDLRSKLAFYIRPAEGEQPEEQWEWE